MARVNLERRAEIGLAKRTRTRAVILQAARTCYAAETAAPVTVDFGDAGRRPGEGHLLCALSRTLTALEAELAGALIEELDESLQPARLAADHPLTRLATGGHHPAARPCERAGAGAARRAGRQRGTRRRPRRAGTPARGPR